MAVWVPWVGMAVAIAIIFGLVMFLVYQLKKEARRSGGDKERAKSLAAGSAKQGKAARKKAKRKRRRGRAALDRL